MNTSCSTGTDSTPLHSTCVLPFAVYIEYVNKFTIGQVNTRKVKLQQTLLQVFLPHYVATTNKGGCKKCSHVAMYGRASKGLIRRGMK